MATSFSFKKVSFIFLILCLLASAAFAEPIKFTAGKVRSVFASGREQTVLSGKARIVTGTFEIQSEEIVLYGKNQRYLETNARVVIVDTEKGLNLSGNQLFYDRDTDILTLRGNTMLEDFKNNMVVKGDILEHRNKENITNVQIGVRVFKKDITARAENLVYRRDQDLVELSGMPVVFKNKDQYKASQIAINLENDEIRLLGQVQGKIESTND